MTAGAPRPCAHRPSEWCLDVSISGAGLDKDYQLELILDYGYSCGTSPSRQPGHRTGKTLRAGVPQTLRWQEETGIPTYCAITGPIRIARVECRPLGDMAEKPAPPVDREPEAGTGSDRSQPQACEWAPNDACYEVKQDSWQPCQIVAQVEGSHFRVDIKAPRSGSVCVELRYTPCGDTCLWGVAAARLDATKSCHLMKAPRYTGRYGPLTIGEGHKNKQSVELDGRSWLYGDCRVYPYEK